MLSGRQDSQTSLGTPQPPASEPRIDQRIAVAAVYVAALFMNIMDQTIVNVAIPRLGHDFGVSPTSVDVVVIAYLVSLAVFIPASGWIGDRFGTKRTLLAAIAIFTVASMLCGVAGDLSQLIIFRVLQGVGGGMLTPVGMAMLYRTFPPEERIRVASILMLPIALAPALGPVLGGLLVTDLSWRWVFYVNVPIGVTACVFGLIFVQERREPSPGRFDGLGFALAGIGLGALMYGVSEGPDKGWASPDVLVTLVIGVIGLGALIRVELHTADPMVDLRLLRNRLFGAANGLVLATMTAFFGSLYLVALFFQDGRGMSPLASGLSTFPEAIGVIIGGQITSRRLYPRIGPRRIISAGLVGIAVCAVLLSQCGAHTNLWWIRFVMFALGCCIPTVMSSMQAAAFATITPKATGRASTLFNANRQLGGAVGVALLSSVLSAVGPVRHVAGKVVPYIPAYQAAFLCAAGVALVGSVLALATVRDADAASTMRARVTVAVE